MKKEDQQYGHWLRVDAMRSLRKLVVTVAGCAKGKTPWKKGLAMPKKPCSQSATVVHKDASQCSLSVPISEQVMVDVESMDHGNKVVGFSPLLGNVPASNTNLCLNIDMVHSSLDCLRSGTQVFPELREQNATAIPNHNSPNSSMNDVFAFNATKGQLCDISNKLSTDCATVFARKWKKIERSGNSDSEGVDMIEVKDRRPSLDAVDMK